MNRKFCVNSCVKVCKSVPSGQDSGCSVPVTGAAHIYHSGYLTNIYLFSKQQNSHRRLESLTSTSGGGAVTVGRVVLQVAPSHHYS